MSRLIAETTRGDDIASLVATAIRLWFQMLSGALESAGEPAFDSAVARSRPAYKIPMDLRPGAEVSHQRTNCFDQNVPSKRDLATLQTGPVYRTGALWCMLLILSRGVHYEQ